MAKQAFIIRLIDKDQYLRITFVERSKGGARETGRALTIKELNKMIDHCISTDGIIAMRDGCIIALMYGAGLRREEVVNLQLSSYKRSNGTISILGKGNKHRINPLNNKVVDILETWINERGRHPGPLFLRIRKGDRITDSPITDKTVYDIIIRRYMECGLERLTPHDLRRTFATKLLENGEDLFVVQDLMGHALLETTKKYDKRDEKKKIIAGKALPL